MQLNGQEGSMEEVATDQLKEKNAPSEFEVDQWCRTCASKKQNLVSMTTKGKGTDMSLLSKLKLLIEIDDEDALPTKMCDECVDKLEQSFKFFQQIYVADNTLRHVFPNTRSSSTPRKPVYSIGEHMRNEQKEKQKEKEKEEEQQQQQVQDRAPKITRGIFRRGRGRPRTRGYAARARARQRSAQIAISVSNSNVNDNTGYESRVNEATRLKNESQSVMSKDEERHGDTVFSLLTDTCHSDEELDWSDVLKVMNDHRYQVVPKQERETKLEEKVEKKIVEEIMEREITLETERGSEMSGMEMKGEMGTEVKVEIETQPDGTKLMAEQEIQRIRCEFCNESFKLRRQLQTHLSSNHSQLSGYMCIDCLTCYENESLLSKHRSLRHGNRIYRCEHCQEEFLEKRVLREHINKCEMHDRTNYSCDSCGLTFCSKEELIGHMKSHGENSVVSFHGDDENSEKAEKKLVSSTKGIIELEGESEYCSIRCSNIARISESNNPEEKDSKSVINSSNTCKVNVREERGGGGEEEGGGGGGGGGRIGEESSVASCPDCNEQMQDTVELSIHRMRRHSMNRKDATCLLCDNKSFSSLDEYEQHVLDHCKRLRISP